MLNLPIVARKGVAVVAQSAACRYTAPGRGSGIMARILLAEDDDNMRHFLSRALRRAGHEVHAVGDGDAALAWVSGRPVDLLLADVVMPGIDGIELARRANDLWPDLRVMFITGFAAVALRQRSVTRREAAVLAKPFHLRQLVAEIDRFLAGWGGRPGCTE
jgi:two-component system, cell cycle response regulator CpdR